MINSIGKLRKRVKSNLNVLKIAVTADDEKV